MSFQFSNAEVAAKFDSDQTANPQVHICGGKNGDGWKGKLSDIPLAQAEKQILKPGQNLLKLKEAKQSAKIDKSKE
jgi:hypothetical protein